MWVSLIFIQFIWIKFVTSLKLGDIEVLNLCVGPVELSSL